MSKVVTPRWGWALTGSGHFFNESSISRANWSMSTSSSAKPPAKSCASISKSSICGRPPEDSAASSPRWAIFILGFTIRSSVVAPATSNIVAKFVYGISDNLASNVFAQAGKCRVPSIVFACDTAPELETRSPDGVVKVFPRRIDLENFEKLKSFEATQVAESLSELKELIARRRSDLTVA
jgi:dihydromethanopterin reductase (acceptor)